MARLCVESRRRVVLLKKQGYSVREIRDRLHEEGIVVSLVTLYKLLHREKETGSVLDKARSPVWRYLSNHHYVFIDNALAENDELTAKQLKDIMVQKWADLKNISLTTIKRARKYLGWTSSKPKYCQLIREANKEKRLNWANEQIANSEQFQDVIFSDECSVEIDSHSKICFRKKGQLRKFKPRPKHPLKVHIWGGISKRGATQIVIFTGILTATRFTEVIKAGLLPLIAAEFPNDHRFQQDNDPKHSSKYAQAFLQSNNVRWWKTPPESPDLNPIENVWGSMKTFLRNEHKPHNKETLIEGIRRFWRKLTPDVCTKYIDHLKKVIPEVIKVNGEPSGY